MKGAKVFFSLILLSQLVGCVEQTNNSIPSTQTISPSKEVNSKIDSTTNNILSYNRYKQLIEDIELNLEIAEFSLKVPVYETIVVVDKDLTFDTRESITVDGKREFGTVEPTSYQFIYEKSDGSKQIIINLSYNKNYIGNDLINWSNPEHENINKALAAQVDLATLSYKNLLITIQQLSTEKSDSDITKSAIRAVINTLKEY